HKYLNQNIYVSAALTTAPSFYNGYNLPQLFACTLQNVSPTAQALDMLLHTYMVVHFSLIPCHVAQSSYTHLYIYAPMPPLPHTIAYTSSSHSPFLLYLSPSETKKTHKI
ncbi:hypothetical protein LINPERHAP1_LOCUS26843, partial [Linum perenne]